MTWQMVKLCDICSISKGKTEITKAIPGEYPMVALSEDRKSHNEYQFDEDAVIIPLVSSTGHGHASMKRIHFQSGKFALGTILCALIPKDPSKVSAEFLYHYLDMMKEILFVPLMKGVANVSLPMKRIAGVEIPLPALSEQESIIEILQQHKAVYKLLDYESEKQKKLLAKYRQAILQEAIEGKLTADWRDKNPDVEPAAELLKRIAAEKAKLVKQKKISKQKPLPAIKPDEIPFEIPESWAWCRLGNTADAQDPNPSHRMPPKAVKGVPFISPTNVSKDGEIDFFKGKKVSPSVLVDQQSRYTVYPHSFAFSRIGTIGDVFKLPLPHTYCLSYSLSVITPFFKEMEDFLMKLISSSVVLKQALHGTTSNTIPDLGMNTIRAFVLPIPPLMEQQEIVRRVEAKFALCDNLEEQISAASQIAETLSAAILQEFFDQNGGKN